MIILDTNVVSERIRPLPDKRVVGWFDTVDLASASVTTVTVAELRAGVAIAPQGRRRAELELMITELLESIFSDRVEVFDFDAANAYASVIAQRRQVGRPIEAQDAMIAAICLSRGASLATRNTKDFDGLGITLINPWEY